MFSFGYFKKNSGLEENKIKIMTKLREVAVKILDNTLQFNEIYGLLSGVLAVHLGQPLINNSFLSGLTLGLVNYLLTIKSEKNKLELLENFFESMLETLILYQNNLNSGSLYSNKMIIEYN